MPEKNNLPSHVNCVTILGSGTCTPSLDRSACALLVETGRQKLLLDMGPGTIRRLTENGTSLHQITHILLSHFHPDHAGELAAFLFASKYGGNAPRTSPLNLIAGKGIHDFFSRLSAVYPGWIELGNGLLTISAMGNRQIDRLEFEAFSILSAPMRHNPESIAFRIETRDGRAIVYSGDTDENDALTDIAKGADLFVCESAFPDDAKVPGHLTPSLAGKAAAAAGVRHLVLTHFYPACDKTDIESQCRKNYKGRLTLARDLLKILF